MRCLQLLVGHAMISTVLLDAILDKSVIWTTHDQFFLFSHQVEDWTSAKITPTEFGQTISSAQISTMQSLYGVASDSPAKHLVMSDRGNQHLSIYDIDTEQAVFFHMGTSKDIGQLTIDWLGHNVYWADTGYGWIAMKQLPANIQQHNSLNPDFKVVADKNLEKPTGIVVHPEKFYLFWTDTGGTPKIERSDLIGGNRTSIIWKSLITPTTLCIDQSADRLYWTDPERGTIEYSDFDGNDRKILLSDPDVNYYGIAVFRDSLIYTAPAFNRTGYVSLKENNEGEHVQAFIQTTDSTTYHVLVYALELQDNPRNNMLCDLNKCDQMCLYMEQDAGFTCLCDEGYELVAGETCSAEEQVLERHILFTNQNNICAIAISALGLSVPSILQISCDIITEQTVVTRFALDMTNNSVFYTNGTVIFMQEAFKDSRTILYQSNGTITDMDYNWKTKQLFWIESVDGFLYYIDVNDEDVLEPETKKLSNSDVTSLAVDPHNRKVFWIAKNSDGYSLNVWDTVNDKIERIQASLLVKPTDLEYDRPKDRLLWNDEEGHVGIINTDSSDERKYDSAMSSGENRHAIAAYKNFILITTAEDRQFDIIYELEPNAEVHMNLQKAYDGPVLDLHVYESALQPTDLEPCEVENVGCDHICLPGNTLKCACFLGYILDTDQRSCKTVVLDDNFFVVLDTVHDRLYQIDLETETPYVIEIGQSNKPTALTFDPSRNEVIWVDADKRALKKKKIGSADEIAVWSGVDENAAVAVDVSTGNVYMSSGGDIIVVGQFGDKTTIIDSTKLAGTVGKIAVMPESGIMAWFEDGDSLQIAIANMDGTNIRPISLDMKRPEDIAFDLNDENNLYWCDSELDKIERIDTQSLSTFIIYKERGLRPVAIEIVADILYFVPRKQRKIVQLNKNTGLDQTDVIESPLFGSFINFFFARDVAGHGVCANCNGGCSNLCLPIGKSKKCACAEDISLKDDEFTCQYTDVCPQESYTLKPGLDSLTDCCPNLPNAVCKPFCQSGYNRRASVVRCKTGEWNVSLSNVCEASEDKPLPIVYIAAGAGGGIVLLVIVVVVTVCLCRRNRSAPNVKSFGDQEPYTAEHGYEVANGILSPDPPKPQPEPEVYDYLDEKEMVDASKLQVALPTRDDGNNKKIIRENSTSSRRYTSFPDMNYITPTNVQKAEPKPDYGADYYKGHDVTGGEDIDGYLMASSVSGGSLRDTSNGSFSAHPENKLSDNKRYSDDPHAVRYLAGHRGNMSDGRVSINSRSGRDTANTPWDTRFSGHRSDGGQMSLSGSFGYSGHI